METGSMETFPVLEIEFNEFLDFYSLFNSGQSPLYYKETETEFIFVWFANSWPHVCRKSKEEILAEANVPDNSTETVQVVFERFRQQYLRPIAQARPFIRFGGIE